MSVEQTQNLSNFVQVLGCSPFAYGLLDKLSVIDINNLCFTNIAIARQIDTSTHPIFWKARFQRFEITQDRMLSKSLWNGKIGRIAYIAYYVLFCNHVRLITASQNLYKSTHVEYSTLAKQFC